MIVRRRPLVLIASSLPAIALLAAAYLLPGPAWPWLTGLALYCGIGLSVITFLAIALLIRRKLRRAFSRIDDLQAEDADRIAQLEEQVAILGAQLESLKAELPEQILSSSRQRLAESENRLNARLHKVEHLCDTHARKAQAALDTALRTQIEADESLAVAQHQLASCFRTELAEAVYNLEDGLHEQNTRYLDDQTRLQTIERTLESLFKSHSDGERRVLQANRQVLEASVKRTMSRIHLIDDRIERRLSSRLAGKVSEPPADSQTNASPINGDGTRIGKSSTESSK